MTGCLRAARMAVPSCFFVCVLTNLLPRIERQWSFDRFAILDFHASARSFGFQRRQTFERLARVDGDLDVRPVSDALRSPIVIGSRAAAFVLERPLIRAQVAVPAALLPITI